MLARDVLGGPRGTQVVHVFDCRLATEAFVEDFSAPHREERLRLLTAGAALQASGCCDNAHAFTLCQMPHHLTL